MPREYDETPLIPPMHIVYKAGALPRTDRPGTYCGFFRDIKGIHVIPVQEWGELIDQGISMMPNSDHPVYDQDSVGSCFPAGTMISMSPRGKKAIEDVVEGDTVRTRNTTGQIVLKTHTRTVTDPLVTMTTEMGIPLRGTWNHPVLSRRGPFQSYVPLAMLAPGDQVVYDCDWQLVDSVSMDAKGEEQVVYNLSVAVDPTYMADGFTVHNCASEGACGALEITRDAAGLDYVLFNPWGTYHYAGGGRDNGSTLTDNMRLLREMGAFPESVWPRSKGYRPEPSAEAKEAAKQYRIDEFYEIQNWEEYGSALLQGFCVYSAWPGHAWCGVAVVNDHQLKMRNSWGTEWGDNGYGIISKDRLQFQYGCFAIRTPVSDR